MKINRELLQFVKIARKELSIKILMLVGISATFIVQALAMAKAVGVFFSGGAFRVIYVCTGIALIVVILRAVLTGAIESYSRRIGAIVKTNIRRNLYDKIKDLGPGYVMDQRSGKIQSVLMEGVENMEPYLLEYLPQICAMAITGLSIGIASLALDTVVGLILIGAMILCIIIPYITMPFVMESVVGYWRDYAFLNAQYVDAIQGVTTLKAFNSSKEKGRELKKNAEHFYKTQLKNTAYSLVDSGLMIFVTSIASYISLGIAAYRADMGLIASATVPVFLFLTSECARPMINLNNAWHSSMVGISSAEEIFRILNEKQAVKDCENATASGLDFPTVEVVFDHVTFQYPRGSQPALLDVCLTIPAGKTVAVIGSSGSGKSTLINLLYRFYEVQQGQIQINGKDIRAFQLEYLRRHISVVFQENYLINGTVRENITMADSSVSDETMLAAAKAAGADEFIEKMPNRYDTIIGERGSDLSGGQRQRLAIARALIKNVPIRIFDEATSNVDAISEKRIKQAIDSLSGSVTTIVIAHRLSTIVNADLIYVMNEGKVVECGTHAELIEKHGIYSRLYDAQYREERE